MTDLELLELLTADEGVTLTTAEARRLAGPPRPPADPFAVFAGFAVGVPGAGGRAPGRAIMAGAGRSGTGHSDRH